MINTNLFDFLKLHFPALDPAKTKVHIAASNAVDHPLDEFRKGTFKTWQEWQSKNNFNREFVVSLIPLKTSPTEWLFAGVYKVLEAAPQKAPEEGWGYNTEELIETKCLSGKVVVSYLRKGRNTVRLGEEIAPALEVIEVLRRPFLVEPFISTQNVRISKDQLDKIVEVREPNWVSGLSSVRGIYVISDVLTGKLYVGKATSSFGEGTGGIWSRWENYSRTSHGDNEELKRIIDKEGLGYSRNFQYAILEVCGSGLTDSDISDRETHWKEVLLSRGFGNNRN